MAKPRIFVSSTYFDLKSVRADLEYFIRDQGFDPVLHERGSVPYGKQEAMEQYCYEEIGMCDILVSIVGGRFGSDAQDSNYSVSQTELRVARELQKQVYIFIDRGVFHEYRTYEKNKDGNVSWATVDDVRIFQFIDELYKLKNNNPIEPFDTSFHITQNLKEQWAGLFQRLLTQSSSDSQANMFLELRHSLETARSLVEVVASRADAKDEIVADLILTNHPVFSAIRSAMNVPYRILFYDLDELTKWIEARGYRRDDLEIYEDKYEWINSNKSSDKISTLYVSKSLFDEEGKLKPISIRDWSDDMVAHKVVKKQKKSSSWSDDVDDDIPF